MLTEQSVSECQAQTFLTKGLTLTRLWTKLEVPDLSQILGPEFHNHVDLSQILGPEFLNHGEHAVIGGQPKVSMKLTSG